MQIETCSKHSCVWLWLSKKSKSLYETGLPFYYSDGCCHYILFQWSQSSQQDFSVLCLEWRSVLGKICVEIAKPPLVSYLFIFNLILISWMFIFKVDLSYKCPWICQSQIHIFENPVVCGGMSWRVTATFLLSLSSSVCFSSTGCLSHCCRLSQQRSSVCMYMWMLLNAWQVLWLVKGSSRSKCFYCCRWPLPPWQCVVLVGVHPDLRLQCSMGSPPVRPQQDSQCHLVPGKEPALLGCNDVMTKQVAVLKSMQLCHHTVRHHNHRSSLLRFLNGFCDML